MRQNRLKSEMERRLYPRIYQEIPFQIQTNGFDFTTTTKDISCTGAYCSINKYLPPFTKLAVKMTLPVNSAKKQENLNLECKGVVVRTDDQGKNEFNIAIFFNEMNDAKRKKIYKYVKQFLP